MKTTDKNERIFKQILEEVYREWSRPAFEKLGDRVQRALLAEAVLAWANRQDESVSAERIREVIDAGQTWAYELTEYR